MAWEDLSLTRLREIARYYNKKVKIAGIAKLKKEEVISELKKHLDLSADNKSVKHRTDKSDIMLLKEGKPKITAEYKATGKGKEYKKTDPKKAVKIELADLEKKSAMKKRIKAQAEGAKADKEAIKPPTVAEATDFVIKKKMKPKKKEIPTPPEPPKKAEVEKSKKEEKKEEDKTENLSTVKEKILTTFQNRVGIYNVGGKLQAKRVMKFLDEKIKNKTDLYKWLYIMNSIVGGNGESVIRGYTIRDYILKSDGYSMKEFENELEKNQEEKDFKDTYDKHLKEWETFLLKTLNGKQQSRFNFKLDMGI